MIGNPDFDLAAWAWVRNFDLARDTVASKAAGTTLDSDSVFVECGIIRRLAMLLVGWGSLGAEKKARWRGHWIDWAGGVELPDKNSGASWNEVIGR